MDHNTCSRLVHNSWYVHTLYTYVHYVLCVYRESDYSRYDVETTEEVGNIFHGGLIRQSPKSHHISLLHQRCTVEHTCKVHVHEKIRAKRHTVDSCFELVGSHSSTIYFGIHAGLYTK